MNFIICMTSLFPKTLRSFKFISKSSGFLIFSKYFYLSSFDTVISLNSAKTAYGFSVYKKSLNVIYLNKPKIHKIYLMEHHQRIPNDFFLFSITYQQN